ncbi:M56 family metallopeptidase [Nonlabens ponticola]|uniref:Peptidase M56 domain-containing protein n=1 Tax=Nonlabens ponticola TaxID=2496866 RepID=A0A3S9MXS0_9FLAO|nr:M56 family metallopeptidase [Nonlabens ponticola]AZQ43934.1 hypothetical protein EJ995_06695 [Nonlabens ponticola]
MEQLLEYLMKSAGVLAIFVLAYQLLLRRLTFFRSNRWFLLLGMVASIAVPFIEITQTVYVEQLAQPVFLPQNYDLQLMAAAAPQPEPWISMDEFLLVLYLSISLFFIGKMAVELLSLRRLILSGKMRRENGFVMVALSRKVTPFSFFNYICYYRKDKKKAGMDLIMDHEKVHARDWHSIDLLISHLYRAIFWINPLAWLLKRQIGENLEFIADATAKVQNETGVSYEHTLLSSAASHMQPALANNFFTPFIKKRIQMLQKETSKQWNAYKYALILPVLVLFLYSFNVVEKIEYIKKEKAVATALQNVDPLAFDITLNTTQAQLNEYAARINANTDYKIELVKSKDDDGTDRLRLKSAFGNEQLRENVSMILRGGELIILLASDDELQLNNAVSLETFIVNENGTSIKSDDRVVYGTFEATDTISKLIKHKIVNTTTKESLDDIKASLKKNHNVDFDYSRARYKSGKLTRLTVSLDDNDGTVIKQSFVDNDGIDSICITGVITDDEKSWSMGDCDAIGYTATTYSQSMFDPAMAFAMRDASKELDSLLNTLNISKINDTIHFEVEDYITLQEEMKRMNFDSIQQQAMEGLKEAQIEMQNMNWDSIQQQAMKGLKEAQIEMRNMNWDSIQELAKQNLKLAKLEFERMNWDSIQQVSKEQLKEARLKFRYFDMDSLRQTNKQRMKEARARMEESRAQMMKARKDFARLNTDSIREVNKQRMKESRERMEESRAQMLEARKNFRRLNMDSIREVNKQRMEEARERMEESRARFSKMNLDSLKKVNRKMVTSRWSIADPQDPMTIIATDDLPDPYTLYNGKSKPLFILDGKEAGEEEFRNINPQQIESVSVLKDENAISLYGDKGKNGVIIIVTKTLDSNNSFAITDFNDNAMQALERRLEQSGHTFKIRTLKRKNGKPRKIKFDLDDGSYTFDSDDGLKKMTIRFDDITGEPQVLFEKK